MDNAISRNTRIGYSLVNETPISVSSKVSTRAYPTSSFSRFSTLSNVSSINTDSISTRASGVELPRSTTTNVVEIYTLDEIPSLSSDSESDSEF